VPALYRKLSYDAVKDFAPITLWVTIPNVLVVHPSVPVQSTKELIALARAKPGELRIGTQGNGSSQHLATELFKIMAGNLDTIHVPYKGSGASIMGVLTGEVAVLFPTLALSQPHIQAGKIRALAVTTAHRLELRNGELDRAARDRAHAAVDRLPASRDERQGAGAAGSEEDARGGRHESRLQLTGGVRDVHTERDREVDEGGAHREDRSRLVRMQSPSSLSLVHMMRIPTGLEQRVRGDPAARQPRSPKERWF
jgi:hypothetical protein